LTYLFNRDVFTNTRFYEILLAINELQVTVLVPLANIAGLEPAIRRHGFGSLLRVFVVSAHNVVSSDPDLALVIRSRVARFGEVDEFDVRAAGNAAEGVVSPFERVAERADTVMRYLHC
jgi:hypothetical protein